MLVCELVFEPLILGEGDVIKLDSQRGPMHSRIPGRKKEGCFLFLFLGEEGEEKRNPCHLRELLN